MALAEIIACAPFRLPAPRPLTAYEWNIVGTTISKSAPYADANALVGALQAQPCAAWKTSAFGPPPAVSTGAYEGLGRWYVSLDAPSRANAIAGITRGDLCKPGPWQSFYPQQPTWEGGVQNPDGSASSNVQGLEACARERQLATYVPTTGQDIVNVAKLVLLAQPQLANQVPPFIMGMIQNGQIPQDFLSRSFLFGIEFAKPGEQTKVPFCSEVALIWAPGQGASVADLFGPNGIDLAKLIVLLQAMAPSIAPSLIPAILPNLGSIFPGLLQQIPGLGAAIPQVMPQIQQNLPSILAAATQVASTVLAGTNQAGKPWILPLNGVDAGASSPHTPPTTGVPIVDGVPSETSGGMSDEAKAWIGVALGIGVVFLVLGIASRYER